MLCNHLLGTDGPPNRRLNVPNINIHSSPRFEDSNTKKWVVSQCPLLAHKTHNPLISSYNYPDFSPALFLLTCPTQGMYPFIDINTLGVPLIYQGLSGTCI
jgi:hypothetical protein